MLRTYTEFAYLHKEVTATIREYEEGGWSVRQIENLNGLYVIVFEVEKEFYDV